MAKLPTDPPSLPDADDIAIVDAPTAQPTAIASSASSALARSASPDVEVIFRAKVRRVHIVLNVIVAVVLSAAVGWFLFSITIERPWYGVIVGVLLVLLGARGRVERDELTPIEVIPALGRKRAIELHFESKPPMIIDSHTARFVDAEATGNSREGYTHWVVVRREGESQFRFRVPSRAEAIRISKRLRVILQVPPYQPLGEDELEGDDYPPREA